MARQRQACCPPCCRPINWPPARVLNLPICRRRAQRQHRSVWFAQCLREKVCPHRSQSVSKVPSLLASPPTARVPSHLGGLCRIRCHDLNGKGNCFSMGWHITCMRHDNLCLTQVKLKILWLESKHLTLVAIAETRMSYRLNSPGSSLYSHHPILVCRIGRTVPKVGKLVIGGHFVGSGRWGRKRRDGGGRGSRQHCIRMADAAASERGLGDWNRAQSTLGERPNAKTVLSDWYCLIQ